MAKRVKRQMPEQKFLHKWWARLALAAVFIATAYGLASLAIDSGSLFQYGLSILFLWWAGVHMVKGFRLAFAH